MGGNERVLIHAPYGRDAALIQSELQGAGFSTLICESNDQLCAHLEAGAAAALVGDEALPPPAIQRLADILATQPAWSDFPFLVMTTGGASDAASRHRLRLIAPLRNITLLERPLRPATLISSVHAALRARRHQYELRDHLALLENSDKALRESEERYRFLADSIPQMVWTAKPDGALDYVSQQVAAYFGTSRDRILGNGWFIGVHPDDQPRVAERWNQVLSSGEPYEAEFRLHRAHDGAWRWFLARAYSMTAPHGKVLLWVGTCTDIHDQKQNEEALRHANRELEEFTYVASHDLQEPLRMINIYTQIIMKHLPSEDPEVAGYAEFVRSGVTRMENLIRDLLVFSRTVHAEPVPAGVADLSVSLSEALAILANRIEESGAILTVEKLPETRGDTDQLVHVFQNLLSNSLKYSKADEPPKIDVSASQQGSFWKISVRDNGIGFEQQYATRIFGLFKRLHKDAYPGTGLGLAICQRIVERYGGRMWAESSPGDGAAFHFTLPAIENQ